jgi:hypothetical protein
MRYTVHIYSCCTLHSAPSTQSCGLWWHVVVWGLTWARPGVHKEGQWPAVVEERIAARGETH